jgi:hypothetical protein
LRSRRIVSWTGTTFLVRRDAPATERCIFSAQAESRPPIRQCGVGTACRTGAVTLRHYAKAKSQKADARWDDAKWPIGPVLTRYETRMCAAWTAWTCATRWASGDAHWVIRSIAQASRARCGIGLTLSATDGVARPGSRHRPGFVVQRLLMTCNRRIIASGAADFATVSGGTGSHEIASSFDHRRHLCLGAT